MLSKPTDVAVKHDDGKLPLDLIPPEAIFALGEVLAFGAKKYGRRNWEKGGLTWDRLFAAAQRHLWAYHRGEFVDPESGLPHLWHALACIAFVITYDSRGMLARE